MKNNLVEIINDDLFIGTWRLSKVFDVEHRSLKQTIRNNINDVIEVGEIEPKTRTVDRELTALDYRKKQKTYDISNVVSHKKKPTKFGPPIHEYLLNEPQATFVVLLLKGQYKTDKVSLVTKFKKHITSEFFRQRRALSKLLVQKQNAEWLQKRAEGKLERRVETDTIKEFVEYSKDQGSKKAGKYYMIISKMENQSLFNLDYISQKYPNIRDIAEGFQLTSLQVADRIVAKAIKDGMEEKLNYKDIYIKARDNVQQFAQVIGKTPLQLTISNHKLLN